jgi:hypothetical protein
MVYTQTASPNRRPALCGTLLAIPGLLSLKKHMDERLLVDGHYLSRVIQRNALRRVPAFVDGRRELCDNPADEVRGNDSPFIRIRSLAVIRGSDDSRNSG